MIELPLKIEVYCYDCGSELETELMRTEVLGGIGMAIEVKPCGSCAKNDAVEKDCHSE